MKTNYETAVFGGGCFWCTEAIFAQLYGVISVESGYAGGKTDNPDYDRVSTAKTGHAEVIKIIFDPIIISYKTLLDVFWAVHDPTTLNRQGADIGTQYRSIILYTTKDQKKQIKESLKKIEQNKVFYSLITTEVKKIDQFYPAESYHQRYYENNKEAPYCQIVISPKIKKLKKKFPSLLKE